MNIGAYLEKLFSLKDKVVLLTGAAGGIGSALARGLADCGASMALADIAQQPLESLIISLPAGNHRGFVLDISKTAAIKACVRDVIGHFGRVDVLINCAGINKREGFLDVEEDTYDRIMSVNLKGLYFITQAVVRESMMKTGGKIINIASYNSTSMLGGVSVYGASKTAIAALTRSMAVEWAKFDIQANAIAPGHILTSMTTANWADESRADYLRSRIAARRPGLPEELVGMTILLSSGASSYVSGDLINVDGGAIAGGSPWKYDTKY